MSKPARAGLDYFPLDTHFFFNRKIQRLLRSHGLVGVSTYLFILTRIYEQYGYYIPVDKHFYFDISIPLGKDETYVKEVVDQCLKAELFHTVMFRKKRILTSAGIQKRFLTAKKKGCRTLNQDYLLLKPAEIETIINEKAPKGVPTKTPCDSPVAGKNDFSAAESPQSKA